MDDLDKIAYDDLWAEFEKLKDFCWKETFRADDAEAKIERLVAAERICRGRC